MRQGFRIRSLALTASLGLAIMTIALLSAWLFDTLNPPPRPDSAALSVEVTDRDGQLLRVFATPHGRWRLKTDLAAIDPAFLDLLIAYEDKRFRSHAGVDTLAMTRAVGQLIVHRRVVSGGSTITMQLARLLEPRPSRTLGAKLWQMVRAVQLERRMSKDEILAWYLTLAPYGGNLEGIRAASLAYFGRDAQRMRLSEAALLVALPQSPERRRPDRHPEAARAASLRVLERAVTAGLVDAGEVTRVGSLPFIAVRRPMPAHAAHLAERARVREPGTRVHRTPLRRDVQSALETLAARSAESMPRRVSVAIVVADSRDGAILAQVGSPGFTDGQRAGWIDMTIAPRSPGSALKPFIYGLAFEEGLVMPETLISDRPSDFGGYRPRNFDQRFQGDVSVREALQLSLNVPAVALLDGVGPARLAALMRRGGADFAIAGGNRPGLPMGLGGVGVSLVDLVQLYGGLAAADGHVGPLWNGVDVDAGKSKGHRILEHTARWHVTDILRGIAPPSGSNRRDIAFKTGTSYGYRDAWAVGYDGRYVIGVWTGRADNMAVPGLTGYSAAAPLLFEAFARSGLEAEPFRPTPAGAVRLARADLPPAMFRYRSPDSQFERTDSGEAPPHIAYPPAGVRVETGYRGDRRLPLVVKLQGGRPPFRWLANGRPLEQRVRRRELHWVPDGPGSATLLVIDAAGRTASVDLFVD